LQDIAVARSKQLTLAISATSPNRAHRVDYEPCRKVEARRNTSLSGRASDSRSNLGDPATRLEEIWACGVVDCPVDTTPGEKPLVRRVDDRIHLDSGDIAKLDTDGRHWSGRNVPAFTCGRHSGRRRPKTRRVQRGVGRQRVTVPYSRRRELNRRYSSTDASISDFRMETLSTLMPMGKCFSRA
jgi:hypothetical protein